MANTLPDVIVTKSAWVNLYTATGITVGTQIDITNKTTSCVLIVEAPSAPSVSSVDGFPLNLQATCRVTTGSAGVWARSLDYQSNLVVQASA